ncbi:MFS general substrate transporter [Cubamyces sp. BRFM 1775]|nr:MFS general substrate transporter [Cubamyces sp. BRFM 1775]
MSHHPAPESPTFETTKGFDAVVETLDTVTEASEDCQADTLPPPPILSAEEERRLWRKIDKRLIPISTLLYLVSYLDRGSIGNAKLQGLTTQLDLTGDRYNIALTMFYLFYCVCTIPSNLLLKKFRPSKWIPGLALAWGIVATLMGLVKTYPQFIGVRICLGVAEAGFSPGIFYLLSMWYPRHMLSYRFGLFWAGGTCSGAFSGLIAYGISFMSGTAGLLGWSWIFIVEGLLTVIAAIIAFFGMSPTTAEFLTPEERSYVIHRLKDDNSSVGEEEHFEWRHIPAAIFDWKIFSGCLIDVAITGPIYGISLFLPSIINGFGFNPAISQLLSVPPYVIATATAVTCSHYSDVVKMRSPFIFVGLCITFLGFCINISNASIGVKYAGLYFVVVGAYSSTPMVLSWLGNNAVGHYKRGVGLGMQVMFGNIAGIIASNIYRVEDAPRYIRGHVAELSMISMGLVVVPTTAFIYARRNARKDVAQREREEKGMSVQLTEEEVKRMGENAPGFRYTL